MSADIILFPAHCEPLFFRDNFRKALVAVAVLLDFDAQEAAWIINEWVVKGLLTGDEADALYTFYGWKSADGRRQ